MSEKKLYNVEVTVIFDMAVAATSEEEARVFAVDNYEDELRNVSYPGVDGFATEMKKEFSGDFHGCAPYNSDDERTVDRWFEDAKTE